MITKSKIFRTRSIGFFQEVKAAQLPVDSGKVLLIIELIYKRAVIFIDDKGNRVFFSLIDSTAEH